MSTRQVDSPGRRFIVQAVGHKAARLHQHSKQCTRRIKIGMGKRLVHTCTSAREIVSNILVRDRVVFSLRKEDNRARSLVRKIYTVRPSYNCPR